MKTPLLAIHHSNRDIYSGHSPPPWRGEILSKVKNREEFEGELEKRKRKGGKRRKKEKSDKIPS